MSSACPHNAAPTGAPMLAVGFVVTQSLLCTIITSGTLQGLDSILNRGATTRSDFSLVQTFRARNAVLLTPQGHQELSPTRVQIKHSVDRECYSDSHQQGAMTQQDGLA